MEKTFKKFNLRNRIFTMIRVDFRRMFTIPLFYLIAGICFIIPILIFVMTTMVEAPQSSTTTMPMPSFTNVWQTLGSLPTNNQSQEIDMLSMCNINLIYFAVVVLICIFVSQDFKSGYTKNLFTTRASKIDYVLSKTLVNFMCGTLLLLIYLIGALIGGAISNLSFELTGFNSINIIMCMLSKTFLLLVFISISLVMSVIGKQKTWLSMLLSFGVSMLLFMIIPTISPLTATMLNVILSLLGGLLFSIGIGAISNLILKKTSLV